MNIRILGIILLLLLTVFMVGIDRCDRSEASPTAAESVQPDSSPPDQTTPPPEQKNEDIDELTEDDPNSSLSPREYGRENPFVPLVRGSSARRAVTTTQKKTTASKPEKKIIIRLTAILGGTAILSEDGTDKTVSVGDTIGGMKVLEIQSGEVVLGKGDEKHTIALGTQIEL